MKKTKLFTLALVLGLLAGCGDSDSQKGDNNKSGDKVVLKGKADSSSKSGNAPQEEESKEVKLLLSLVSSLTFKDDGSVDIENTKFDIAKTQKRGYCPDGETLEPGWDGGYDANGKKEGVWTQYGGRCESKNTNTIVQIEAYKNGVLLNETEYYYLKSQTEPLIVPWTTLYYGTIEGNEHLGKVLYYKALKVGINHHRISRQLTLSFFLPNKDDKRAFKQENIYIVSQQVSQAENDLSSSNRVDAKCYCVDGRMYKHASRKIGPYKSYSDLVRQMQKRNMDVDSAKTQEWHLKTGKLVVDSDEFDASCDSSFLSNAMSSK